MEDNWRFKLLDKSDKKVDPFQSQFFTTEVLEGITSALIRETIQNSLDAKSKSKLQEPIAVRFFLSGTKKALPIEKAHKYFSPLAKHIHSESSGLQRSKIPDLKTPLHFLVIEDYNTVGLEGDPTEFDDPPKNSDKDHNFYWFWRNVGRSGKKHDERGRWGLGKAVYPKSSYIHTYFGLTVRESDSKALLMGESILAIHKIPEEEKLSSPYGYFGEFKDEDPFFVTPIEEKNSIDFFIDDFHLNRKTEGSLEPGLSIIIPTPTEEIDVSSIIKSTVLQYFYPLLSGQLEVKIEHGDREEDYLIKKESVEKSVDHITFEEDEKHSPEQLKSLLDFAKWSLTNTDFLDLKGPDPTHVPVWKKSKYFGEDQKVQLNQFIEDFDQGKRVAFTVPVKYHKVGKQPSLRRFKVFFEKDESIKEADCHFIRDGITLVGIKPLKRRGVRALVVIDDPSLSNLLGDSENPAHTEWSKDSKNFIGKYEHGDKVISFIIHSVERLYSYLLKPSEGLDKDILGSFFYLEDDAPEEKKDESGKGRETPKPPPPPDDNNRNPVIIRKLKGGVEIKADQKYEGKVEELSLKLAYQVAKGNAFSKYSPFDFDLAASDIEIETDGLDIVKREENKLILKIKEKDFRTTLCGFDTYRDLILEIDSHD